MTNDIASRSTLLIKEMHKRRLRFNINLYNNLVHHHIKRNKFEDAQKVLDQMTEHREVLKADRSMRQRTLSLLLAMYLKSGDETRLQALVNQDPSSSSSSSSEFGGQALSQTMSEFLRWTKGLQLTNESISRVKTIFHGIQEQTCPPNTPRFTHLLQRQFEDNRPQDAYRLMKHILDIGFHPNAYTSSSIMSGLLNARLYDEAIYIWDRIKEDPEARSDQVLLNSLLSALCQDPSQFPTARELWNQILANPEIKPDVITFSNMLNGYFRAKDPSSAMMLWDQMRERPYSIKPNVILYNAVMTGLFHNHQPKEAMAIFDQMVAQKDMVLPLDTFQIMIKGLLSVRDVENLGKVLLKMEQAGVEKDAATYTIITDTLFSQRDAEAAKQVADLMTERKVAKNPITYSAIIAGLVNVGDFERARRLFKEMQEAGHKPTIHTFGAMMQGAFKAGDVELAESMAQLAKQNTKEGMSAGAYSIMISGYSSLLMMDKADHWFQEFRRAVIPASSTSSLPSSSSSSSQLPATVSADGPKIPWRIFYVQLKACVEHRLWAPADRVLRSMEELGFESNVPKLTRLIRRVEDIRAAHPEQFPSGPLSVAASSKAATTSSSTVR
jgi:pentatricopeptide repeat protein